MQTDTSAHGDKQPSAGRALMNNPVSDSWQSRMPDPVCELDGQTNHQDALDLVGHTLNGRPMYRAWQLALLLGISPAVLSSSLGAIPTNLRPFEILEEEHEAISSRRVPDVSSSLKVASASPKPAQSQTLEDLRRLAVLARTTEPSILAEAKDPDWSELVGSFHEF